MTWDSIFAGSLILVCITSGMIAGAWLASRGFSKALKEIQEEVDEGKWDD